MIFGWEYNIQTIDCRSQDGSKKLNVCIGFQKVHINISMLNILEDFRDTINEHYFMILVEDQF